MRLTRQGVTGGVPGGEAFVARAHDGFKFLGAAPWALLAY